MSTDHILTKEILIEYINKLVQCNDIQNNNESSYDMYPLIKIKYKYFIKTMKLGIKKQLNDNIEYINFYDHLIATKEENIDFYSFMCCLFYNISPDFQQLSDNNKISQINMSIYDFINQNKRNDIVTNTPTFICSKNISKELNNKILTSDLIQFMSIYFNINIFVIDTINNYVIYYTMNNYFNRYKKTLIFIKLTEQNLITGKEIIYYQIIKENSLYDSIVDDITNGNEKIFIYNKLDLETYINKNKNNDNNQFEDISDNNDETLKYNENELIYEYIKNNLKIITIKNDEDLSLIQHNIESNQNQNEKKNKKKKENKANKLLITQMMIHCDSTPIETDTMSIANNIIIKNKYTSEELNNKDHKELREIAKTNHIKLSVVLNTGKRKNKTKNELITELLEIDNLT